MLRCQWCLKQTTMASFPYHVVQAFQLNDVGFGENKVYAKPHFGGQGLSSLLNHYYTF